jgi:hypothetical protein
MDVKTHNIPPGENIRSFSVRRHRLAHHQEY